MAAQNIFNNVSFITESAMDSLTNNLQMGSRVKRYWENDPLGSQKIGDTLNVRKPGYYGFRTGAAANPQGYNDTYTPIVVAQGGVDILLTSKELTLNLDDFNKNVMEPIGIRVAQEIDKSLHNHVLYANQFYGSVTGSISNITPFLQGYGIGKKQSAMPEDGKVSGALDPLSEAGMIGGMASYLNPTKEISEQYRNGSLGYAGGMDFFSSANVINQVLGTWSGTLTVGTAPAEGGSSFVISGMTGSFAPGENFTLAGVYAVNPVDKSNTGTLKQFVVTSQVGTTVNFEPAIATTGPLQNVTALPSGGAAVYPWGNSSATALVAGTGQVIRVNSVFHEDFIGFAMCDLEDTSKMGGVSNSSRKRDPKTGIRLRNTLWYNGYGDQMLLRLDVLYGSNRVRQGNCVKIIEKSS